MMKLKTTYKELLSDTITPVSIYLKLRDRYPNSMLLESSDYHANDNSFSYICCNPIASFKVENEIITTEIMGETQQQPIKLKTDVVKHLHEFTEGFEVESNPFNFTTSGLFGYTAYDAVRYFEDVSVTKRPDNFNIPDLYYAVYQTIIAINHFNNTAYLFNHSADGSNYLDEIEQVISAQPHANFSFNRDGTAKSNITDQEYKSLVNKAKQHCQRGDVFQLVLSKRFEQPFNGDEFNVYRALRSVNPSPYLFYFDFGDFKIFGSSPEAQLVVENQKAEIHPIAGTFKRTGDDQHDAEAALQLSQDPKENAEHVMLVDLARNDLSRNGSEVKVETYKEIQYFSHVIHLVSKVTAQLKNQVSSLQVAADTFPAGTLSGAPKPKALELIETYEPHNRNAYGGAIGVIDFNGNYNHAIIIRSFLSKNHTLYYQAGAGIVSDSKPENELQEVYNKLGALNKALQLAETL